MTRPIAAAISDLRNAGNHPVAFVSAPKVKGRKADK